MCTYRPKTYFKKILLVIIKAYRKFSEPINEVKLFEIIEVFLGGFFVVFFLMGV